MASPALCRIRSQWSRVSEIVGKHPLYISRFEDRNSSKGQGQDSWFGQKQPLFSVHAQTGQDDCGHVQRL